MDTDSPISTVNRFKEGNLEQEYNKRLYAESRKGDMLFLLNLNYATIESFFGHPGNLSKMFILGIVPPLF